MTTVRIPAPDIEADVSAEQVVAYLLAPERGWTEAVNLSAHWRKFTIGLRTAHVPRSALVSHRISESIHDIARAEQRHPSAVLADIVGPAMGVVGRACASVPVSRFIRCGPRKVYFYRVVEGEDESPIMATGGDSAARGAAEESE